MQSAPQLKTILVVEDDFSVLTAIKCMLEASHHNVLLARTADVAISIAQRKGVIDLLLMDVVMPDIGGPDLAETILAIHPSAKVLFLSGYGGSDVLGEKVRVVDLARGGNTQKNGSNGGDWDHTPGGREDKMENPG